MPPEFDLIGPWSEVKLDILREYAAPYSKILTTHGFYHRYIDSHAGRGSHVSKATGEVVDGSPRIALSTDPPFREYHFIETNPVRVGQLRQLAANRSDVYVHEGDCNDVLLRDVLHRAKYEDRRRALCLLDPYNIDLAWEVVSAVDVRSVEIFLNFMVMDMNMNVLLNNPEKADKAQLARMDRFWGDRSWYEVTYELSRQSNLFTGPGEVKVEDANEKISEAYRKRLLDVAGFKYVPRPLRFVNSLGKTIYYLFFASPNETGKKIVESIFKKDRKRPGF